MQWLDKHWYRQGLTGLMLLLMPLSWLYQSLMRIRRWCYLRGYFTSTKMPHPVIVVGNLSVGGTGKSPMVLALVQLLKQQGCKPGIVSRGYGGSNCKTTEALLVTQDIDADVCGDEAKMLAERSQVPVVVCRDRVKAARECLHHDVDVIISDDGLQHYALQRDIEIIMMDNVRRLGNQYCLPSGPLREHVNRLLDGDFVVVTGGHANDKYSTQFTINDVVALSDSTHALHPSAFVGCTVHAVAGIGHPQRFFQTLRDIGVDVIEHAFEDHYVFSIDDFAFDDNYPIIMTEKDAVKCNHFANGKMYYLKVSVALNENFTDDFLRRTAHII